VWRLMRGQGARALAGQPCGRPGCMGRHPHACAGRRHELCAFSSQRCMLRRRGCSSCGSCPTPTRPRARRPRTRSPGRGAAPSPRPTGPARPRRRATRPRRWLTPPRALTPRPWLQCTARRSCHGKWRAIGCHTLGAVGRRGYSRGASLPQQAGGVAALHLYQIWACRQGLPNGSAPDAGRATPAANGARSGWDPPGAPAAARGADGGGGGGGGGGAERGREGTPAGAARHGGQASTGGSVRRPRPLGPGRTQKPPFLLHQDRYV